METPFINDAIREIMQDSVQGTAYNKKFIINLINNAISKVFLKLNPIDQVVLWRIIDNDNKSKLSGLAILNFINYQLRPTGEMKVLRTKAFDKSRRRVYIVNKILIDQIRDDMKTEYKNYA